MNLFKKTIKYVNHRNQTFVLQGDGLSFVDAAALYSYSWSWAENQRPGGMGGTASQFARSPRTFALELRQRGFTDAQYKQQMNTLHAVTEVDTLEEQPGRLYIGDEYMRCYLGVGGSVKEAPRLGNWAVRELTVLTTEPWWSREVTTIVQAEEDTSDTTGKKYNLRYPYRYGGGSGTATVNNAHYAAAPAVITVYGPANGPSFTLAGIIRAVDVNVLASERLVIDQIARTIRKIGSTGAVTDCFNLRDKRYDIFAPVPPGENLLVSGGDYKITVTLIQQRSEPTWS